MKLSIGILLFFGILFFSHSKEKDIERMDSNIFQDEVHTTISYPVDFNDTIPNDTLFIDISKTEFPLKYWRKIITEVCIDGECRRVQIDLFWNITGRYMGFRLPNGEFLSKTEHDPFNDEEYNRMHNLLGDANSTLANYSLEELVIEPDTDNEELDGVSSATLSAILDYIVEGAVYTSYTLWHIAHGSTKLEIERQTIKNLNSDLILKILKHGKLRDQIWVLNHIPQNLKLSEKLYSELLSLVAGADIYLAERSLNAIPPNQLNNDIQYKLSSIFNVSGFLQKRLILHKLKQAPTFNAEIIPSLTRDLSSFNGALIKALFELLKIHNVQNAALSKQISTLLKNDNRYISNQAYLYLKDVSSLDKKTQNNLNKYKKKLQLP